MTGQEARDDERGTLTWQGNTLRYRVDENLQLRTHWGARDRSRWERDGWTVTPDSTRDDEREAKVWRKHPGLGGQDGIGVRHPDGGGHQWYTVDRAEQVVAELTAGLIALRKHPEPEITDGMVEKAALELYRAESPVSWSLPDDWEGALFRRRARNALEAALRVPVGEGEQ